MCAAHQIVPGYTREDSQLSLDEAEQAQEAEIPLELRLVAQLLEVCVVHFDDVDLRTFCIGVVLNRPPC